MRPNEPFYTIPKDTMPAKCKGEECGATIYWIDKPRAGGKPSTVRVPIDANVPGGSEPDSLSDGKGVSHFATCVNAGEF